MNTPNTAYTPPQAPGTGSTSWDYLPYLEEMNRGQESLGRLINSYEIAQPREIDVRTARNAARQAAYARGIDGPLAASVEADAVGRITDAWNARRDDTLATLLDRRTQNILAIQQAEWQRRVLLQQERQARAEAEAMRRAGILRAMGTIGGGIIGGIYGGPMGAAAGASVGGGAGGMLGGFL